MSLVPSDPTIIISDLHLGHRASKIEHPEQLAPILRECKTVIFNGDTAELRSAADRPVGRRLAAEVARVCHAVGCKAIFVNGNHDPAISKTDHVDLMDGRMLITHGDILFLGVAPWSHQALAYRKIHLRALAYLGPDDLMNFEKRLLATKRTSIKLQLIEGSVTQGSRSPGLRLLARQLWPPHRPFMILLAWWQTPTLAAKLVNLFRPCARYVVVGHTHYPGCWQRRGVTVINTGSYVLNLGASAVLLNGQSLEIRQVIKQRNEFVLGRAIARFYEGEARLADSATGS